MFSNGGKSGEVAMVSVPSLISFISVEALAEPEALADDWLLALPEEQPTSARAAAKTPAATSTPHFFLNMCPPCGCFY